MNVPVMEHKQIIIIHPFELIDDRMISVLGDSFFFIILMGSAILMIANLEIIIHCSHMNRMYKGINFCHVIRIVIDLSFSSIRLRTLRNHLWRGQAPSFHIIKKHKIILKFSWYDCQYDHSNSEEGISWMMKYVITRLLSFCEIFSFIIK